MKLGVLIIFGDGGPTDWLDLLDRVDQSSRIE